jgi:hypothetical protein
MESLTLPALYNFLQPSTKFALSKETTISESLISKALDYVIPSEQLVMSAKANNKGISALVRFDSPKYTVKPVNYLSSSSLAVSIAQVSHVLLEFYVENGNFPFQKNMNLEYLAKLRENHELYFIDIQMQFHEKYPAENYNLHVEIIKSRKRGNLSFNKMKFNVGEKIKGSFVAIIPLID